jgi:1-acyl-sn-glycerol-3-phosphate acyltransferase
LFYDFVKITAAIPGLLWFRPKKIYANKKTFSMKGGRLLICNHSTNFDPVYVMLALWTRRHHFVATKDLFRGKFLNLLFKGFLCIPIDKQNFSLDSFKEIVEHLKNEEVVTMFPEGKVNATDSELQAFKSGMVLMAYKSGKPIVPVYIKGREHFYQRLKVVVGEQIDIKAMYPKNLSMKNVKEVTDLIYERENELKKMI